MSRSFLASGFERIELSQRYIDDLSYDEDQFFLIQQEISKITERSDPLSSYEFSDLFHQRDKQFFAIFGKRAYELLPFLAITEEGNRIEYRPVVSNGRMVLQSPADGRPGLLYLMRFSHRRHQPLVSEWRPSWLVTGWLATAELDLSDDEIDRQRLSAAAE